MIHTLVFVRALKHYPVPPVCHAQWTADDWKRTERTAVEPLVIDAIGYTWLATGDRLINGKLVYRGVKQCDKALCSPK